MGYVYQGKTLCCDFCSEAGARKMRCPFGWCQPLAACADCRKKGLHKKPEVHENCAESSARFAEERRLSAEHPDSDVIISAIGIDDGVVKVTTRDDKHHFVRDYEIRYPVNMLSACTYLMEVPRHD